MLLRIYYSKSPQFDNLFLKNYAVKIHTYVKMLNIVYAFFVKKFGSLTH